MNLVYKSKLNYLVYQFSEKLLNMSIDTDLNHVNNSGSSEKELFKNYQITTKGFIEINGEVVEALPATTFKVKLENGQEILAHMSGKIRMNKILIIPGDRVKLEISPYDLTKGRIIFRY